MFLRIISLLLLCFASEFAAANNAYYITLSNQVARKQELEIITNNAANSNTIGYEEDAIIFDKFDVMQSRKKNNSFVVPRAMYKSGDMGPLKQTNNPLDVAIMAPDQYFKVRTSNGIRYTLAGNMFRNSQGLLVNSSGHPYLTLNNDVLQIPLDAVNIQISADATIYAEGVALERIGVVMIPDKFSLAKEGESLYRGTAPEVQIDDYTVMSGALRISNVNAARVMSQTIETQRSFSATTSLLNDLGDMEKQAVNKHLKQ